MVTLWFGLVVWWWLVDYFSCSLVFWWCDCDSLVDDDSPSLIEVCDDAVDSLSVRLCLEGGWLVE